MQPYSSEYNSHLGQQVSSRSSSNQRRELDYQVEAVLAQKTGLKNLEALKQAMSKKKATQNSSAQRAAAKKT